MTRFRFALLLVALSACRPKAIFTVADKAFSPPVGKRAVSIAVDRSQVDFLSPGDVAEVVILAQKPRPDGTNESSSETLAPHAEVLRVNRDWGENTGLISLALSPEEAQFAALAIDLEDRLFLNKLPDPAALKPRPASEKPTLESGSRGLAVLVYPDQQTYLERGDRVDVIATRHAGKSAGKSELAATTLFQNILVLGVRAAVDDEEWSTVQLMLTPEQAQVMRRSVGAEDGLTLAARAPGDQATRSIEPAKMSRRLITPSERSAPKS